MNLPSTIPLYALHIHFSEFVNIDIYQRGYYTLRCRVLSTRKIFRPVIVEGSKWKRVGDLVYLEEFLIERQEERVKVDCGVGFLVDGVGDGDGVGEKVDLEVELWFCKYEDYTSPTSLTHQRTTRLPLFTTHTPPTFSRYESLEFGGIFTSVCDLLVTYARIGWRVEEPLDVRGSEGSIAESTWSLKGLVGAVLGRERRISKVGVLASDGVVHIKPHHNAYAMVLQTSILDLLLLHKIVVDTSKAMNISVDDLPDLCGERFVEIAGRLVEGRCEVEDLRKVREGGIMDVEEVRRGVKGEVRKVLSSECLKPDTIIQGCIRSIGCLGEMSKTVWECIVRMCNGINNETIKALRRDWFLRREERIMKRVVDMDVWSDIAQLRYTQEEVRQYERVDDAESTTAFFRFRSPDLKNQSVLPKEECIIDKKSSENLIHIPTLPYPTHLTSSLSTTHIPRPQPSSPQKHLIVLVHGLLGSSTDFRAYRNRVKIWIRGTARESNIKFLLSKGNEAEPFRDLWTQAGRLGKEVLECVEEGGVGKVSFLCHSLGGIIARCAIALPEMENLRPKFYSFITLGAPHLSINGSRNMLFSTISPFYRMFNGFDCLKQLTLGDAVDMTQSLLYKLAIPPSKGGLNYLNCFHEVKLYASIHDGYVDIPTALAADPEPYAKSLQTLDNVMREMMDNFSSRVEPDRVQRYLVWNETWVATLFDPMGRKAHVSLVESQSFFEMLLVSNGLHLG